MDDKLSYPELPLPDAEETIAFRAVAAVLRDDSTLQACNVTFRAWEGNVGDLDEPAVANCPYMRLTPAAGNSGWINEGQHELSLDVTIEAAVVGSDVDQLLNLWAAIRRALWPGRTIEARDARRQQMRTARILRPTLTRPAFQVVVDDKDAGVRIATAAGTLKLILHVDTP